MLPVGLNSPGFSFVKWIGIVGELVGFGGYLKKEKCFLIFEKSVLGS